MHVCAHSSDQFRLVSHTITFDLFSDFQPNFDFAGVVATNTRTVESVCGFSDRLSFVARTAVAILCTHHTKSSIAEIPTLTRPLETRFEYPQVPQHPRQPSCELRRLPPKTWAWSSDLLTIVTQNKNSSPYVTLQASRKALFRLRTTYAPNRSYFKT